MQMVRSICIFSGNQTCFDHVHPTLTAKRAIKWALKFSKCAQITLSGFSSFPMTCGDFSLYVLVKAKNLQQLHYENQTRIRPDCRLFRKFPSLWGAIILITYDRISKWNFSFSIALSEPRNNIITVLYREWMVLRVQETDNNSFANLLFLFRCEFRNKIVYTTTTIRFSLMQQVTEKYMPDSFELQIQRHNHFLLPPLYFLIASFFILCFIVVGIRLII